MRGIIHHLGRVWFTGFLFLIAVLGYCAYGVLWLYRKALIVVILTVLIAGGAVVGGYFLHAPGPRGETAIDLIVKPGTSLREIAATLRHEGIVPSARALALWLKLSRADRRIQSGKFTFRTNDGIFRAAESLMHAQPIERKVTVPEGLTIEQIASVYHHGIDIDSAEFVKICSDPELTARADPQAGSLEGYLFPDTYRFAERTTARQAVERMLGRFEEEYATLARDSSIAARYARHQIVTLASIVEKEATLASERSRIAGVFHNRLRLGYPLGADPTVRYVFRKFSGPLRVSELNVDSPYNTRRFRGLPPGPICSPGRACLQAAAAPLKTNELYFVALWDGSGAHDFSRSNAEHDRKKQTIRAQNERRIKSLKETAR